MKISSSICPTELEFNNGDRYDEVALLEAIRRYVMERYPTATIACLQVGHRQGDKWATIDGDSDSGNDLLVEFFNDHGTDENLFVEGGAA